MDPDATLADIEWTLKEDPSDTSEIDSLCQDLQTWLDKGGFEPTWKTERAGTAYFRQWQYETGRVRFDPAIHVQ